MATVVFRNAYLLVNGAALQGEFTELTVETGAESLDGTTFGADTRIHKGGLFDSSISGSGIASLGTNAAEEILFGTVSVEDTVLAVFPDGITEGTTTVRGYAMLGVVPEFSLGGAVGTLLPFSFSAQSRNAG